MQGAAQGAAMGAPFGPWGAAIGAVAGGILGGSGGSSGGGAASDGGATAQPHASQAAAFGSGLDGSAWVVNFGNGNSTTLDNRQDKTIHATGPTANANAQATKGPVPYSPYLDTGMGGGMGGDPFGMGALGLGAIPPVLWLVLGGAVLWKVSRKSRK